MKKLVFAVLVVTILVGGCMEKNKAFKIYYDEYYIKGAIKIINNDTIFNGPIEYYDSKENLIAKIMFKDNLKHGKAIRYYNGKVIQETNYFFDHENGMKLDYDSLGALIVKSNYLFGRQVGPRTNYIMDLPYYFRFVNFDQQILYDCKFENGKVKAETGSLTHYTTDYIQVDGNNKLQLFFYIIEPPFRKVTYSLYDVDLKSDTGKLVHEFTSKEGYIQNYTLNIPETNHRYVMRTYDYSQQNDSMRYQESDLAMPEIRN